MRVLDPSAAMRRRDGLESRVLAVRTRREDVMVVGGAAVGSDELMVHCTKI